MHGARISCASIHMHRAVYRRKWLEGHLAPPPNHDLEVRAFIQWFRCVICEMRNLKTPRDRHLKWRIAMYFGVHTVQNTVFRILIQNAHFELKFKLRTLLSCENSSSVEDTWGLVGCKGVVGETYELQGIFYSIFVIND